MYMEIKNNKNEIIFKSKETKNIIHDLMFYMYEVSVKKSRLYKIKYNYNYSDLQTIVVKENFDGLDNNTITFYNIPTKQTFLDMNELGIK